LRQNQTFVGGRHGYVKQAVAENEFLLRNVENRCTQKAAGQRETIRALIDVDKVEKLK
jgi:hypothetical protein